MRKRTFWWRGRPNFGDELAREIVDSLTPYQARWASPENAELVVTGSIATMLPQDGWRGTILGIGTARPAAFDATRARVLALRGDLTRHYFTLADGAPEPALGDPGLLAHLLVPRSPRPRGMVVIPHWQDAGLAVRWMPQARLVRVESSPLEVIAQVAASEAVVSSSLHGIVVADAYGIPRMWEPHAEVQGGGFKFLDHASVVGPVVPHEWGVAPRWRVEVAQTMLVRALESL